ncbi:MAG: TonB-dependent receptor [Bacteroidota bacterium]
MQKNHLLTAVLLVLTFFLNAQNSSITGKVISDDDKTPLESATIYLERVQDSSLVTYTITDAEGKFELFNDTNEKKLNLFVTSVGYKTHYQRVNISEDVIQLPTISLAISTDALDEVVIKSRAPITIKKDTLEFNVKSFKTKKDANVEDLLKELPGVEVDEAGNIKVNGKDVSQILVNGKPFFGDDPTITTRNLTKDIIEKVQVVDTKTKSEAFSGEEGDSDNKTINLTIKEENNKGVFGRVAAGGGTDERYEYAGIVNLFDNDRRISVLAGGNNINTPGFSFGEIQKMFGGGGSVSFSSNGSFNVGGRGFGGGEGIVTSRNIGANYADVLSEKIDINADYFYSESDSENDTRTERENILPDSRFFTSSDSRRVNENRNHSFNMGFDIEIDSTFLINVTPSFRFSQSENVFSRNERTRNEAGELTNQSFASTFAENTGRNFSNEFQMTKRFGSGGSFLRVGFDTDVNSTEADDFLNSETNFFNSDEDDVIRDQFTDAETEFLSFRSNLTYRIPIVSKTFYVDLRYNYQDDKRTSLRSTFDRDVETGNFDDFNFDLSTDFEYFNTENVPAMRLVYRKDKWSVSAEARYVFRTLENQDFLRPELSLKQDFEAVELRARFNKRFSDKASIYSGYSLDNEPPNLTQLQPFQNVNDPLNTVTGNPNLEPTNRHRLYAGYNAFDWQKRSGFYSYLSVGVVEDQVVTRTVVDPETLKRSTTYANVDGNYDIYANANLSKTVKIDSLVDLNYDVGISTSLNRNINFNNEVQYESNVRSLTPSAGLRFTWKKVMEFRPRYRLTFTENTFDIDNLEDFEFVRHNLDLRLTTFLPKGFEWRNIIDYSYNPQVAEGFQRSIWFWNSTLAYSFMKDKATLTLKVFDLLNQNNNARRTASQNFIQDSQSTVLEQYFMLSFSWKFNSLGSKGETGGEVFFFD